MKVADLQKALGEWWKDYNHLLGDASGDSECRQRLQRIIERFSVFKSVYDGQVHVDRKQLSEFQELVHDNPHRFIFKGTVEAWMKRCGLFKEVSS